MLLLIQSSRYLCLRGNPTFTYMPKSYRKSEAIAAPNQGKDMTFYLKIRLDSSPIIATITIANLDIERRYYSINRIGTNIQGLMLPLA